MTKPTRSTVLAYRLCAFRLNALLPVLAVALLMWSLTDPAAVQAQDNPDFQLAENGITVTCENAEVGDSGEVDGTVYTKRTVDEITPENAATTCTSGITDMGALFEGEDAFDEDISTWDVSDVTLMPLMFRRASSFNQDIGHWDVSNVTQMHFMFDGASAFNQDIGDWDVSNVITTASMFQSARSFNQDISGWDLSSIQNMSFMFFGATSFDQDLREWQVASTTDRTNMFAGAESFNPDYKPQEVEVAADPLPPAPGMLFEMMGTEGCETIPADISAEEMQAGIEAGQEQGQPMIDATMGGFFNGPAYGISLYGSQAPDTGFAALHSMWTELEGRGMVTLCIITAQSSNQAIEAGHVPVADPTSNEVPDSDAMMGMGVVIELAPSSDESTYRQRIIGEMLFMSGQFELSEWSEEGYSGTMQLAGEIGLEDGDELHGIEIEASIDGMPGMPNVPDFTLED